MAPLGTSLYLEGVDGYIGQIWTGPVNWALGHYHHPHKSFFTSAYALYDYFTQLTARSPKKLWLLIDPVEDARLAVDVKERWDAVRRSHLDSLSPHLRPVMAESLRADAEVLHAQGRLHKALGAVERALSLDATSVPAAVAATPSIAPAPSKDGFEGRGKPESSGE